MSEILTVFEPKGAINYLLARITEYPAISRVADIDLHLVDFIANPIIQEILNLGADLVDKEEAIQLETENRFHSTLRALSTSIQSIQKQLDKLSNAKGCPPEKGNKGKIKNPPKTYSAIVGARPPNPSLVVDLAHLRLADDNRLKPEVICNTLNERLGKISPPQATLAAVRWTAQGNLVVTGAPNVTSHTLQTAAPNISAILTKAFQLPSDNPLPTA